MAKLTTILDFEKSIAELDANLEKLRQIAIDRGNPQNTPDLPAQIAALEENRVTILKSIFAHLTPWDNVLLARHKQRPYMMDYVNVVCEDFQELHGDRLIADDGAIVAGIGRFAGRRAAIIGHQKGRDIAQRQHRNFGYARPEGYRKAGRVMELAAKFGLPIITLVDTPGAAADVTADERGISEAIARNMFEMATLPVPIVSVIIGEGGSGGALGIALADRVLMLEHSVYSVISPEGCASILWRDAERGADAANALNLTAQRAKELGIIDDIIPEPLGGAHRDWKAAAQALSAAVSRHLDTLAGIAPDLLVEQRYEKFRKIGQYRVEPVSPNEGELVANV